MIIAFMIISSSMVKVENFLLEKSLSKAIYSKTDQAACRDELIQEIYPISYLSKASSLIMVCFFLDRKTRDFNFVKTFFSKSKKSYMYMQIRSTCGLDRNRTF
jgi:hypothetical protein